VPRRGARLAAVVVGALAGLFAFAFAGSAPAATPTVTEFTAGITTPGTMYGIAPASDGKIWFTNYGSAQDVLGIIDPANTVGGAVEVPTHSVEPWWVTNGPDGRVYWTSNFGNSIGSSNTSDGGELHTFYGGGNPAHPFSAITGPDGNLWATEARDGTATGLGSPDKIGLITPGHPPSIVNEISLTGNADPLGIAVAPQDLGLGSPPSLWATEYTGNRIARLIPVSAGGGPPSALVKEYLPLAAGSQPYDIALGPDGNIWFTELGTSKIGRFSPPASVDDAINITEFPLAAGSSPQAIAPGPDGNMWIALTNSGTIARMDMTGQVTGEYTVPSGAPNNIAPGSDGNMWFVTYDRGNVGRITTGLDQPAFRNTAPINLPNTGLASPSSISVSGLQGTITDVNVRLKGLSHTFPDDLDFILQAPDGQFTMLASDVGSASVSKPSYPADGITLSIDDSAPRQLSDNLPLVSGIWKPTNILDNLDFSVEGEVPGPSAANIPASLATFNGAAPNGTWKLWIDDDRVGDSGKLYSGWGLDIATTGPPTPPPPATQGNQPPPAAAAAVKQKCKKKKNGKRAAAAKKCKKKGH
jgi:streptogramin lyase/subtilisin-like proprotein convertase family protein